MMVDKQKSWNQRYIFVCAILVLSGIICLYSIQTHSTQKQNPTLSLDATYVQLDSTQSPNIIFTTARSGYEPLEYFTSGKFIYEHLKEHVGVIEPYAQNEIRIIKDANEDVVSHAYVICSQPTDENTESECITGLTTSTFTVECDAYKLEVYDVIVSGYNSESVLVSSGSGTVLCQYVRREIRKLTEDDLSTTLDAMYALSVYTDEEGSALFGSGYSSAKRVVETHYYNAAQQDSDHIHEGNGFLLQHLKITNMFDTSMQSVEPSIVLPYWDFTIDSGYWKKGQIDEIENIFSAKMFGNFSLAKDSELGFSYSNDPMINARIPDGRWADLKTEFNTRFSDLVSGYGYLRAPWNMNPSPYISRFSSFDLAEMPGCDSHYKILEYTDMMEFMYSMSFAPHGSTHGVLGGVYGCDKFQTLYDAGYIKDSSTFHAICVAWITTLKELYRSAKLSPKTGCTVAEDYQSSRCGFTCEDRNRESIKLKLKSTFQQYAPEIMGDDGWAAWTDFLCDGDGAVIFAGDHLEAASPADPSFWVIHPTLERLLHAKLISGGFETDSWASDPRKESVCDHHECYELSVADDKDYFAECCDGHFKDSKLLDFINGDRCTYVGITNADMLKMTDPTSASYSMPYIYADFNWDHCNQNFNALLLNSNSSLSSSSSGSTVKNADKKGPSTSTRRSLQSQTTTSSTSTIHRKTLRPTGQPTTNSPSSSAVFVTLGDDGGLDDDDPNSFSIADTFVSFCALRNTPSASPTSSYIDSTSSLPTLSPSHGHRHTSTPTEEQITSAPSSSMTVDSETEDEDEDESVKVKDGVETKEENLKTHVPTRKPTTIDEDQSNSLFPSFKPSRSIIYTRKPTTSTDDESN